MLVKISFKVYIAALNERLLHELYRETGFRDYYVQWHEALLTWNKLRGLQDGQRTS